MVKVHMKIGLKDLVEAEKVYSKNFYYWLFMAALMLMADIFLKKLGTVSEFILMILMAAAPLSLALRDFFAFRALKKGKFYLKKCMIDYYFYPFVIIDGKLKKCQVPYDIEGDRCYLVGNGDFSYFIIPYDIELDDYLRRRVIDNENR